MNALLLALALATGPADTDLPRSLSFDESPTHDYVPVEPALAKAELALAVGPHLGVAGAYDAEDPTFLLGLNGRLQILPWLAADASIDFQLRQNFEQNQIHLIQVPFEFAAIFYPPVGDLPFRPYAQAGLGFTITDVNYTGGLARGDDTSLNLLFLIGFGVEFDLNPNLAVDANLRFVFAQDPPHFAGNSADWIQFTVGLLFRLSK